MASSAPVSIPAVSPRAAAATSGEPPAGPGTEGGERAPFRVLLVDDDPATLMAMKHHLVRMRGPVQYQGAQTES
jgi:hypothetical protein